MTTPFVSGERTADDCTIVGARLPQGATAWTPRFVMADTPDLPHTNCCIFIDPRGRLRLPGASYGDPSIIQARDGTLYPTYRMQLRPSAGAKDGQGKPAHKSIRRVHFNEARIRNGD
jgi:hypothetical protein